MQLDQAILPLNRITTRPSQPRRFRPRQTMTRQSITPAMPHIMPPKNHLLPQSARGITQPNRMGRTRHKHAHKICRCKYIAINKKDR
jgi:hypothetical protein